MLEGILLSAVLSYVFGYIALQIIYWLFDRPASEKQMQQWSREIDEKQKQWLNSPEFRKLKQEQMSRLQPEQPPEQTGS